AASKLSAGNIIILPVEIKAKKVNIIIIKPIQLFKKLNNYFPHKFI
ncbi:unnamed protein product, partial [marine sediment metagenome]